MQATALLAAWTASARAVRSSPEGPESVGCLASTGERGDALQDTVARVVPWWQAELAPRVERGERVVVAAHGNSLRALAKHLDRISDQEILGLNIPTGIPLVYELDAKLRPISKLNLASAEELAAAQHAVAAQGKAKR